jgi:anthranilate synthase/aminodeoxychorismate synthase-like glutamine amidotransferase
MLLLIDNYDSFTYNLYQYFCELDEEVVVVRNDKTTINEIEKMNLERIVISPGPSTPLQAGISNEVIRYFSGKMPILGVCLGHQCIGYSYGAPFGQANQIMHKDLGVLAGLPNPFPAIRYHSLIVKRETLPDCFEITAWTDDEEIMGLRHKEYLVEGIQFHPESFMTPAGKDILRNFLKVK